MGARDETISKLALAFELTEGQKSAVLGSSDVGLLHILAMSAVKSAIDNIVGALGGDAVEGPASAVDGRVALFDGSSGKLIKDSGLTLSGTNTGDQNLSAYALTASLGTAAAQDVGYFATAAQGAAADAATSPGLSIGLQTAPI